MNAEQARLEEARTETTQWKKWGPYLSERQWGTVREDYSENGDDGTSSPTIMRDRGRIAGAKMASEEFQTTSNDYASLLHCGMAKTRSSRSACSGLPTAKKTAARTSRSTTSTSTARQRTCT